MTIERDDMLTLEDKDAPGFWYVATPYSKYPGGPYSAFVQACKATGWLIKAGFKVFSPIAHSHPIADYAGINPFDHRIWLPADKPLMDAAQGLIVVMMPGWDVSIGVCEEITVFQGAGKPVRYLSWNPVS